MFKEMKVFDCQKMPTQVRCEFLDKHRHKAIANGNYVLEYGHDECDVCSVDEFNKLDQSLIINHEIDGDRVWYHIKGKDIVSDWLLENGANFTEEVLVKHWW